MNKEIPKKKRRFNYDSLLKKSPHKGKKVFTQFEVPGHGGITMEDKFDKQILPWIAKLREIKEPKEKKEFTPTQGQPPSFYEKDMEKWKNKFTGAIKDREKFKKTKMKFFDFANR